MKLKKVRELLLAAVVLTAVVLVTGCANPNGGNSKVTATVSFLDNEGNCLPYKNGATNVNPKEVKWICLEFSEAMNTNYSTFVYYGGSDVFYDVNSYGFSNSYVYCFCVNLNYGTSYKVVFNDDTYVNDPGYTKEASYLRDYEGNYLKMLPIEFTTCNYTRTEPKEFTIDLQNFSLKLVDNNEYNENTQQCLISDLKWYLNNEILIPGDTVKINYNIYSPYDLKNVRVNLADNSEAVNYWLILNEEPFDQVLAKDLAGSTEGAINYKKGTLEFKIKEKMQRSCCLQIWDDYISDDPDSELVSITFDALDAE